MNHNCMVVQGIWPYFGTPPPSQGGPHLRGPEGPDCFTCKTGARQYLFLFPLTNTELAHKNQLHTQNYLKTPALHL